MNFAYVTVLNNIAYIPGIKALKRSLRKVNSKYPLVILVPDDCKVVIDALKNNKILDSYAMLRLESELDLKMLQLNDANHYWKKTFFKLQATLCIEFDKVILIDSDMLVLKNLDHLFDCNNFSAVAAGHCIHNDWTELNSGLLVIEPSVELHNSLIECVEPVLIKNNKNGINSGDQDVFNYYFSSWNEFENLHLPEAYNVFFNSLSDVCGLLHYKISDIYIVHFVGPIKPWTSPIMPRLIKTIGSLVIHFKFISLKLYLQYLLYSKL